MSDWQVAWQIPASTEHYVDTEEQLEKLGAMLASGAERPGPPKIGIIRGPVGGGKTELGFQVAARFGHLFTDGHLFVSFAGKKNESGLERESLRELLKAVGVADIPESLEGRAASWRTETTSRRVLLFIDGAFAPAQVRNLLPGTGYSAVIVTEAGDLRGLRARHSPVDVELEPISDEYARLLLANVTGPEKLEAEPEAVARLIELCAGSTIAVSVAAALLYDEPSIAAFTDRLAALGRLRVLSLDEDSPSAVFQAAYEWLSPQAQRAYRAFGCHPGVGEVSHDALVAALREPGEALAELVRRRLVRETKPARYVLAGELVREHAAELAAADDDLRDRFRRWYVDRAVSAAYTLMPGRRWFELAWPELRLVKAEFDAREWLDAERSNLRALASELYHRETPQEDVLKLAVASWPVHERGKFLEDMDEMNADAAEVAAHLGNSLLHGLTLVQRGFAFRHQGVLDKAAELFSVAAEVGAAYDELAGTARESLGLVLRDQGKLAEAIVELRANLEIAERIGNPQRIAMAKMHLGSVDPAPAALLEAAHVHFAGHDLYNAAKTRMWQGRRLADESYLREALEFMIAENRPYDQAFVLMSLGELTGVRAHFEQALEICTVHGFGSLAERIRGLMDKEPN